MKTTKRPTNVLMGALQNTRAGAIPIRFDLERALTTKVHEPKKSSKGRRLDRLITKYVKNDEGLTIPNPEDPISYGYLGACVHSMKRGAGYFEPRDTEPVLARLWDYRFPISNLKWIYGFDKIKEGATLLETIKSLLDNKVIELDSEADRQKAVELGLIKVEIPTFGDDDE